MLRKILVLVVLALSCQYSYSKSIVPYHGQTGNAAASGLSWNMAEVLPAMPGLEVNSVIYNYRIQKQLEDQVDVYVQNKNSDGDGYIFREHDQWRPGSIGGTSINKVVPVTPAHRSSWGDGSIEVEGPGSVTDARVAYGYRVDPCYDPQYDRNCPGWKPIMPDIAEFSYDMYDYSEFADRDQYSDEMYDDNEEKESDEEKEEREKEEKKDSKERLEKALAEAESSAMFADALAQSQMLSAMNGAVGMQQQYSQVTIQGGTYRESVTLDGGNIPDNKQGRRLNLASDRLHKSMVDMQY